MLPMTIYVVHASNFDFKSELYQPLRQSALNQTHAIILPHETEQFINSKEVIENCDLVIAEVSYPSTGMGIELGWAESLGKKVICIYKAGIKPSSSLKVVSQVFLEYTSSEHLVEQLQQSI